MDFYHIRLKETKGGKQEAYPDFVVGRSRDLMVRGKSFYAIWDEEAGLWSTDEYDVQRLVDAELYAYGQANPGVNMRYMRSFDSNVWAQFRKFMQNISDNHKTLDDKLTFANTEVKKSDYVSRRLPYSLEAGDISAWDELVGALYSVEERAKIEWAIGSIVSGDSKKIQKFLVLYGPAGTGKSTILNIIEKLFSGYTTTFEAKALGSERGSFATEAFRNNPLVAIQHDGDLSRIDDNTRLNSIISHEEMTMNEKYKPSYSSRVNAFLFMGTNQPVKISDAKSGIIRRLIDVHPTGVKLPINHYHSLMGQIDFELGAIAQHCLDVYLSMGKNYYNNYRPLEMMLQTDVFFNFIEAHYDIFKAQDGVSLRQAYSLYKEFCAETGIDRLLPQYKFREELRNYFDEFREKAKIDGVDIRSWYAGFNSNKFKTPMRDVNAFSLVMEETKSIFDDIFASQPAQYAKKDGTPKVRWDSVKTTLADINSSELHYVKVPENHVVIDFDLKDENGNKSLERNLEAASGFPPTYGELSKSGSGVHLHYNYTGGDPAELSQVYSDGIEVKVFTGGASLRRLLSKCNGLGVSDISTGLPLKEKKMLPEATIQSEKGLRDLISRNLRKEIHPGTKPSIDFIYKILEDAYSSDISYDVTDMRAAILAFANNSTNQPLQALKIVQKMKFKSDPDKQTTLTAEKAKDDRLVFFDVEVYPNLFVVCWKYQGDANVVKMIDPSPQDIEGLFRLKLVGFNCRRYDNHILYARYMGYSNEELFKLSQKLIVEKSMGAMFGEAYNLSYTDIYDFSSKKQGLKKFEIELGIHHQEMDIPWDQDVKDEDIPRVVEYCCNDVLATEAVFENRHADFVARQILAELSGLTVNDTTQKHTAKIIFGDDRNPQSKFVYTDLSQDFEGYVYDRGVSTYRGETTGEGGYVYSEPGMYENVALLDIASMHPTSIDLLNLFGPYTAKYNELVGARLAIKHKNYTFARTLMDQKLVPYLKDEKDADALSYALKIVINIVYGLTSAKFSNPFRDPRNIDNIVAKRGALTMIDLKHFVQEKGYTVAHIKTDSIKIPNADSHIIDEVIEFGRKYGYTFEHEATYEKFCLINDAVYIAKKDGEWTATGAQFQHPYVFKTLFSHEPLEFKDYCETKSVSQGVMYIDFDWDKPLALVEGEDPAGLSTGRMQHVGRTGSFVPVKEGGGVLYRVKDDKFYAVTGTKGYHWMEAEVLKKSEGEKTDNIDLSYFEELAQDAFEAIDYWGSFASFVE